MEFMATQDLEKGIMCATETCRGSYISRIYVTDGWAVCSKCLQATCSRCGCGRIAHAATHREIEIRQCPQVDVAEKQLLALAKREGWQRCPECHVMIERTEGCNEMTCECGQIFCYACGEAFEDHVQDCEPDHYSDIEEEGY